MVYVVWTTGGTVGRATRGRGVGGRGLEFGGFCLPIKWIDSRAQDLFMCVCVFIYMARFYYSEVTSFFVLSKRFDHLGWRRCQALFLSCAIERFIDFITH